VRIAVFKIILIPFLTIFIFDSFFQRMILAKISAILHSQFQFNSEPNLIAHSGLVRPTCGLPKWYSSHKKDSPALEIGVAEEHSHERTAHEAIAHTPSAKHVAEAASGR
jgi:hypothetical protein